MKITLAWYRTQYKVLSVTNTTAFKPGEWFYPADVEKWCQRPDFEVEIVDNDIIQMATGVVGQLAGKVATGAL